MALKIMGVDPGFAHIGVSCAEFTLGRPINIVSVHHIQTKKGPKKLGVRAKTDDLRRLGEIVEQFNAITLNWPADIFAFEECPSIMQNP